MNRRALLVGGLALAVQPASARVRPNAFPFPGASFHLSFKQRVYYWGGKGRVQGDFTSFVLGAGTLNAFGLTPAADTVITVAVSALGAVVPGSVALVCTQTAVPGTVRRPFELHDGTTAERVTVTQSTANGSMGISAVDGGVAQANFTIQNAYANNRRSALVGSWATNDVKSAANGSPGAGDTLATMPTLTTMQIGNGQAASTEFLGNIQEVIGFNRALTQSECNELSALLRAF